MTRRSAGLLGALLALGVAAGPLPADEPWTTEPASDGWVSYRVLPDGTLEIEGEGTPAAPAAVPPDAVPIARRPPSPRRPPARGWALSDPRLYPTRYYELFYVPEVYSPTEEGYRPLKGTLPFSWDHGGGTHVQGNDTMVVPGRDELDAMVAVVAEALERYSPGALRASGLEKVVLVKSLRRGQNPMHGMGGGGRRTIWVDQAATRNPARARQVVHHEIGHVLEDTVAGLDRATWSRLNPTGFQYLGAAYQGRPRAAGFAESYGMATPAEDIATVYEALVDRPEWLRRTCQVEPVLRGKVEFMKAALRAHSPALVDDL